MAWTGARTKAHTASRFIARRRELALLEAAYRSGESAFIPIYGRRRVGKSELILHSLKAHPGIYFLGKKAPATLQIAEFLETASTVVEPLLANLALTQWRDVLRAVVDRWQGSRPLILVFDEFQWTAAASPELPSVLQECWDRDWKDRGRVILILCGSFVGFMEREILGKTSPLFGRRTAQILLKPFTYWEAAQFHPEYSITDRARAYFICGGIPLYLRAFVGSRSIEQNIADNLLSEFAPLYREPDFLLREELREVESYYAILLAMAEGLVAYRDISRKTGVTERSLHYYLDQLVSLGYVRRRHPLTGHAPPARNVRYVLSDPLLRFWFRFVYPNVSAIAHLGPMRALQTRVIPGLDAYFGHCFEDLCREALPALYAAEGVHAAFEIGEYWDTTTQIDVVGYRDDGWTDLGECKWGAVRSARAVASELDARTGRYPNARHATIGRRIFTRRAVPGGPSTGPRIGWHTLEDLYVAGRRQSRLRDEPERLRPT